ncbi:MAG: transcription antitermination factor NusB [Christensenellales bacterium]
MDRAILRLSLHELSQNQAPSGVIINEAVELAKRYGDESDSRFVNGVLASYIKSINL